MTTQNDTDTDRRISPAHRLRLELDTGDRSIGGFWWPHSRDLAAELPDLLTMLTSRLGPIHRVIYHLDEWTTVPGELDFGRRQVRLDGYRRDMPARTVQIVGVGIGAPLTIRIITPLDESESTAAQQRWDSEGGAPYPRSRVSAPGRAASR